MSNDMIERVARALAASDRHFSDGGSWDELDPIEHDIYMASARAAIEAMREPTSEMVDAAYANTGGVGATKCWQAMIDEALK